MTAFLEIQLPYRFKDLPDLFEGRGNLSKVTRLIITHSEYDEDGDPDNLPGESFSLPDTFYWESL